MALEFWAGWIDSRNHGWQFYEPIAEHDWPDLARRIATHLEEGSAITEAAVLERFDRRLGRTHRRAEQPATISCSSWPSCSRWSAPLGQAHRGQTL